MVPRATPYRIGVLISRAPYQQTLEGLREGLAQLGYHEGKELAFIIEDAQGEVASMDKRAAQTCPGHARSPVHHYHRANDRGQAGHGDDSHCLRRSCRSDWVGPDHQLCLLAEQFDRYYELCGTPIRQASRDSSDIAPGIKHVLVLVAPQELVATVSFQFLAEAAPKLGIELAAS